MPATIRLLGAFGLLKQMNTRLNLVHTYEEQTTIFAKGEGALPPK